MTEKMDFYGIRDIMNETLNEKKTFVPRYGDKESLDNITAQLNEAKMHPSVFLNNHAIGIEAAGDFMKLLNSGEEQYADNDMVDKDLLKNVYNTLKKIYKDEGKKLKESTMFESVLKEGGIEVYPEDGKLKARNIGQQVVSSRTQNKLNPLGTKNVAKPLTPTQKAATSAVLNILNDKGKAGDINSEFDTNPRPDITLMANGDAVITPDGQNNSYKIPASEIDAHMKESIDPTGTAFNLTKLKGYLRFETRWEYDEDYPEDAMLVDKVHDPARFTVNWIGPEGKKHPNTYCVNIRKDRGESWTWITHFCLKASDAAEMVNLEVGTWEHNNEPWRFSESKKPSLKENECSLEQLLSKAYISEYKMVSKNSALVRVRTSPALLTSDSMAARFEEDIPAGYRLEVEYLGEDPILGKNLDIYEVQLLKN